VDTKECNQLISVVLRIDKGIVSDVDFIGVHEFLKIERDLAPLSFGDIHIPYVFFLPLPMIEIALQPSDIQKYNFEEQVQV
jgi:hypothetical protein